jgi:hypothetical protein
MENETTRTLTDDEIETVAPGSESLRSEMGDADGDDMDDSDSDADTDDPS